MPLMRGYGCSAVLGHHLYVMGGGKSSEWLSDCQRLDVRTGAWTAVSDSGVCAVLCVLCFVLVSRTASSSACAPAPGRR